MSALQDAFRRASAAIRGFFAHPRHAAYGYAGIGIAGLLLAAAGLWLILGSGDSSDTRAEPDATPTATATATRRTATPTRTPRPTATATQTPTPTATPTPTTAVERLSGGGGGSSAPAAATPTATPAVVAAGEYCDNIGATAPPSTIYGFLTIGGAPAPPGTTVTLLFDGAAGPSTTLVEAGGYSIRFSGGGADCANNPGAAIAVAVNGSVFASPYTVASSDSGGIRFDVAVP